MAVAQAVTVEVKVPELTMRLLNAVKAAQTLAESWREIDGPIPNLPQSPKAGGYEIMIAMYRQLFPDTEHFEQVCSADGLPICFECASCGDGEVA